MKTKKGRKRKTYRRKKRQAVSIPTGNRPTLLGDKIKVNTKYYNSALLDAAGVTAVSVNVYSANGLYDPDVTGVGHQPRGWDEMINLYDHAVVINCAIRTDFSMQESDTEANIPSLVGMCVLDSATIRTANDYMEARDTTYAIINVAANSVKKLTMNVNPNKFLGRSKPLSDPNLKNNASSNPSEQCYIHVFTFSPSGEDPKRVIASTKLEYTSIYIEPKNPIQS